MSSVSGPSRWVTAVRDWMLTDRVRQKNPGEMGEVILVLCLTLVAVPPLVAFGVVRLLDGPWPQGLVLLGLAALAAAAPLLLRRTGELALVGNAIVGVSFLAVTQSAWYRGGIESGALRSIGLVPMLAVFTAGTRAGVIWTLLCAADVLLFGALAASGYRIPDQVPAGAHLPGELTLPLVTLAIVISSASVFHWGRRSALLSLGQAERRQRALVTSMPDLLFRLSRDGVFLDHHANRALLVPPDRFLGRNIREVAPVLADRTLHAIERALATGEVQTFEYELELPDLGLRYFESRSSPAGQDEVLVIARDITDKRVLERSYEKADRERATALEEARLLRAERLAAVGQLAAGVGHEINNPLAYVVSNIAYAREELEKTASADLPRFREIEQALVEAADGANRVKGIVADLRGFARPDGHPLRRLSLATVLDGALKMADNEIRHRAMLVRDYRAAPEVLADPGRLTQVFVNLLLNSAHAIGFGHAPEHEIRVRLFTDAGGNATVEVHDSGVGIPESELERVFEPFYTTKPHGSGTGLGLPLSRNIVRGYSGELVLLARPGGGTIARVILPPGGVVSRRPPSIIPNPELTPQRPGRILIVDDDRMIRRSVARLLVDHTLAMAASGREALELLEKDAAFDLVLCDLMMPDMTGIDLFEQVRARGMPVANAFVFVTAGAFAPGAREFLETTSRPCLGKPFSPEELRKIVRAALSEDAPGSGGAEAPSVEKPLASVGGLR